MSASKTTRLASAVAGLAIGYGLAAAAYAEAPPTLPALSAQPGAVTPGGTVLIRGTHCVGTGGQPGLATVTVTGPDGASSTNSVSGVDANGSWGLAVKAPATEGTLSIAATCDIYGQAITYPGASVAISVNGQSASPGQPAPSPEPTDSPTTAPSPHAPNPRPPSSDDDQREGANDSSDGSAIESASASADAGGPASGFDVTGFAVTATALVGAGAAVAYVGRRHR